MLRPGMGVVVLILLAGLASSLPGADKPAAYDDPAKTDADFPIQGEYTGTVGDGQLKLGIQVIALGDGKFHAVGYHGGLPGDGWDGSDKREVDGETKGGITSFKGEHGGATIEKDRMTVTNKDGQTVGELRKITRKSPTEGLRPPAGAVVLFDGGSADNFTNGRKTDDNLLMQGVTSKKLFQSGTVHLEFRTPYMPAARGQARGNSGCYLQGRYEAQILDSFGLAGKNNECGGIYEISDPAKNMCFPPLTWQTYDIDFTAAQYDGAGKKTKDATMTVRLNGVVVQKDVALPRGTRAAPVKEGPEPGPLFLQDHGNPVRFRNIWVVEK